MRRALCALAIAGVSLIAPAEAVTILDSTWKEEGGTKKKPWRGFGAHITLGNEPQFAGAISFTSDGDNFGECSGTWIGNDASHGYVLSAAHCFETVAKASGYAYRTQGGTVLTGDRLSIHPNRSGSFDARTGFDLVIIRLTEPVTDGGAQPLIYAGRSEKGQIITFVGSGNRGTGSSGEADEYWAADTLREETAAQGLVEQLAEMVSPLPDDADGGNYLGIFMAKEDGSIANPYGGPATPANRLIGLLGTGDSGSPAWMQLGDGRWVIVGVGADGSGKAQYGDRAWFVRVATQGEWIRSVFPGALFAE